MSIRSTIVEWFLRDQETRDWLSLRLGIDHIVSGVNSNAEVARNEREWHRLRISALEQRQANSECAIAMNAASLEARVNSLTTTTGAFTVTSPITAAHLGNVAP